MSENKVFLLVFWNRHSGWEVTKGSVVPATKSEDEVTKARKESFIKKQKQNKTNKTTKNETALSRI